VRFPWAKNAERGEKAAVVIPIENRKRSAKGWKNCG
jgi:hypothetical protein